MCMMLSYIVMTVFLNFYPLIRKVRHPPAGKEILHAIRRSGMDSWPIPNFPLEFNNSLYALFLFLYAIGQVEECLYKKNNKKKPFSYNIFYRRKVMTISPKRLVHLFQHLLYMAKNRREQKQNLQLVYP